MKNNHYRICIFSLLLTTIFSSIVLSQPKRTQKALPVIESNLLPGENNKKLYLSSKLSFDKLIFVKNNENYSAGYNIEYTIRKSNIIVDRKVVSKSVITSDYESTISQNNYAECFTYFDIEDGIYTIFPILSIDNTDSRFPLDTIVISTDKLCKNGIFSPIVCSLQNNECNDNVVYKLSNNQNAIPFSTIQYLLLTPINDLSIKSVKIIIEQNNQVIQEKDSLVLNDGNLIFIECDNVIGISEKILGDTRKYFIVEGFSGLLKEGPVKITIKTEKTTADYWLDVKWINKPFTLLNPESALEILESVYGKENINTFFSNKKNELYNSLLEFWDSKLPDRKHKFNDLMNEFFLRADYAVLNFSTLNNRNGAKSDRGIIYIKYGNPDEIDRDYSGKKVIEIWTYKYLNKQFVFRDDSGLGNFQLEK